jgi:thiosulfate/3-mercaptopyruvate sulfurtransferase
MSMLVSTEELEKHIDDPKWIVFDVRSDLKDPDKGIRLYMEGHVHDAYYIHLERDLAGEKTGTNGRHPLPDIATFAKRMTRCGVAAGRQVVCYDDAGGNYAARLWWLLRWLGHENVALLDGQYPRWVQEKRPISKDVPPPRSGRFVPRPLLGAAVDAAFVDHFRKRADGVLVDARSAERFAGQSEPIDPVAGRVPGAINRFWQLNLTPEGLFKAPEVLRKEFEAMLGPTPAAQAVHMCGSGVTACHNLFAMEYAGLAGSRLYPGSWSEWCSDPSRAIATGSYHR